MPDQLILSFFARLKIIVWLIIIIITIMLFLLNNPTTQEVRRCMTSNRLQIKIPE